MKKVYKLDLDEATLKRLKRVAKLSNTNLHTVIRVILCMVVTRGGSK